jgi:hypothetical protein
VSACHGMAHDPAESRAEDDIAGPVVACVHHSVCNRRGYYV